MDVPSMKAFFVLSLLAAAAGLTAAPPAAMAQQLTGMTDPLQRPALHAPRAVRGVMLGVAAAGSRMVAVGERGIALWSDDGGKVWQQAEVPVSVTLTAASFPTANEGWAVGHGGVVLHSVDGGQHWTRQLDGRMAAQLELNAARVSGDPRRIALAEQLLADGPDKPFLAVHFWSPQRGFVMGAFGLIFGTEDGGANWTAWSDRVENPKGLHLNALHVSGNTLYLAGEQGLLLRSRDDARSFQRLQSPYQGSWFAATGRGGTVVLAGLRGNVFVSSDAGANWIASQVPMPVTIGSATATADGYFFTNQAGMVLGSTDGITLRPLSRPPGPPLTALAAAQDGSLLAASFAGVQVLPKLSLTIPHP
jgi:photosystem II stability/assembly factor-like uncharacterized protein